MLPPEFVLGPTDDGNVGLRFRIRASDRLFVRLEVAENVSGDPLLEPLMVTKKPEMTSMGPVAIQLRRAAEAMLRMSKLNIAELERAADGR